MNILIFNFCPPHTASLIKRGCSGDFQTKTFITNLLLCFTHFLFHWSVRGLEIKCWLCLFYLLNIRGWCLSVITQLLHKKLLFSFAAFTMHPVKKIIWRQVHGSIAWRWQLLFEGNCLFICLLAHAVTMFWNIFCIKGQFLLKSCRNRKSGFSFMHWWILPKEIGKPKWKG